MNVLGDSATVGHSREPLLFELNFERGPFSLARRTRRGVHSCAIALAVILLVRGSFGLPGRGTVLLLTFLGQLLILLVAGILRLLLTHTLFELFQIVCCTFKRLLRALSILVL